MRRLVAILLSLALLALATGSLEHLHNQTHAHEDAALTAHDPTDHDHGPLPLHDQTNCETHAQLHLPMTPTGWVPLLVFLGLFVAFLTMLAPPLVSQPAFSYTDSRGPPALA